LKLLEDSGSGGSDSGDIVKIRPSNVKLSASRVVGAGRKPALSYQQVSRPSEEQVDVSAVNNLVESNADSDKGKSKVVTPLYATSHQISGSGSSSVSYGSGSPDDISNYEPGQVHQQSGIKGTGSSSYQLIEFGGGSSDGEHFRPVAPIFSQLISESTNTESQNPSGYKSGEKVKVTSYLTNKNSALKFGDRIPNVGPDFTQTTANVEQDQNEIRKGNQEIVEVTSLPIPQRHSSLRPIIVADIYPKETTKTIRPIAILPTTTPVSIHVSHSPESSLSTSFSSSGSALSHPSITGKHVASSTYSTPTNILSHSQTGSLSYSSESEINSQSLGSVTNKGLSGPILSPAYSTRNPILVSYTKETTSTPLTLGSHGSSGSNGPGGPAADAEPPVYTTPAPVTVSYLKGTSGAQGVTSQPADRGYFTSNIQQTRTPIFVYYSSVPPYSHTSSSVVSGTNNGHRVSGVYLTPSPLSLSLTESQKSSSSGAEENSQQQSTTTTDSGDAEKTVKSQQSIPATVYISNSPKSSSFSLSISNSVNSESSGSVTASNNADSGHIAPSSVHSTTPRPGVEYYSNSEGSSSGEYILSPATIQLNSNSQSVVAALASSAEVFSPIQAGVSLGTESHQNPTAVSGVFSESALTPPKVKEEVNEIPQTKTVVEIQKAISLDFNNLAVKPNNQKKPDVEATTPAAPISYSQQAVGRGEQVDHSSSQQQIYNGDLLEYSYGQPLTGLQVYPQLKYNFPHITVSNDKVLQGYNSQIFEAQKPIQLHGGVQHEAPYEHSFVHYREYTQKQPEGQLQAIPEYQEVAEAEKAGEKYQHDQNSASNLQTYEEQKDTEKQPVVKTYNQQLYGREHLAYQQLPEETQAEGEYSKKFVHTGNEVQTPHVPVQINHELKHQQPFKFSQQIEYQSPIDNNHVSYQLLGQQIGYEAPVEVHQQIEYLGPTKLKQEVEQTINTAVVHSGYSHHTIPIPDHNVQITQESAQEPRSQSQPLYNRNPSEVSKQLQSEYNRQLLEEERQEQVRLGSQLGKALKQIHAEYNEASVGTEFPVHILKGEKIVPLSVDADFPSLPSIAVVPPNQPPQLIEVQNSAPVEPTKLGEVQKPAPVHHTKVVEKPIPVPHAVPVEITKLVAVDRPVPYPQPYAVPHPVPVPYAVPHPIGVPVPHLVPYPHVVTVPYKELHPIYIRNGKPHRNELALYHHQIQNFPRNTPLPVILKALQYNGGRYGVPVSIKPQSVFLTPPPLKSGGRDLQQSKHFDHLRTLCIEYGFKPPLVPSLQIDEVPLSAYGPPRKE
jgi:hypothetical protein